MRQFREVADDWSFIGLDFRPAFVVIIVSTNNSPVTLGLFFLCKQ